MLCDIQGLSYEEAADVEGIALGTVKSRLSRARSRLRQFLVERGNFRPSWSVMICKPQPDGVATVHADRYWMALGRDLWRPEA